MGHYDSCNSHVLLLRKQKQEGQKFKAMTQLETSLPYLRLYLKKSKTGHTAVFKPAPPYLARKLPFCCETVVLTEDLGHFLFSSIQPYPSPHTFLYSSLLRHTVCNLIVKNLRITWNSIIQ